MIQELIDCVVTYATGIFFWILDFGLISGYVLFERGGRGGDGETRRDLKIFVVEASSCSLTIFKSQSPIQNPKSSNL